MKKSQLLQYLAEHNCPVKREGSNHTIVINLKTGKRTCIPRHNELKDSLCNEICKQLGIAKIK